jgi:hypothetical protein
MVRWLSGAKSYGSLVVYLAKESDTEFLPDWKIVHIRGEAAFAEIFYYRERLLRCRNCWIWMFTHSVQRDRKVGFGLVMSVHDRAIKSCPGLAGDLENTNIHLSCFIVIHDAMSYLDEMLSSVLIEPSNLQVVACTNNLASLQSLGHLARQQSRQGLRLDIMHLVRRIVRNAPKEIDPLNSTQ